MQKWEYCVVGPICSGPNGFYPSQPHLTLLTLNGGKLYPLRPGKGQHEADVLASYVARLGQDGWEMPTLWEPS